MAFVVVSFKDGKKTYTYANLSCKKALDEVFKRQKEGQICVILPFVNTTMSDIKGLEGIRPYKEEEETLEYYLSCLKEKKEEVLDLTLKTFRVHEYGEAKAEGRTAIVKAHDEKEAIKKAPFQEWGANAIEIGICSRCKKELDDPDQTLCDECSDEMDKEDGRW